MTAVSPEDLVAQCQAHLDAGAVAPAVAIMTGAYEAAAATAQWSAAAWSANWIGHVHEHHLGELKPALAWFATAEQAAAASQVPLPCTRATARFNAGLVETRRGHTTAGLGHFRSAQQAAAVCDDPALEATCSDRLGAALAELAAWSAGLVEFARAERLARTAGDTGLASSCAEQAAEARAELESAPGAQFARLARSGLDRCLAAVRQPQPGLVLDAGCGSLPELLVLARYWPGCRLVGVDVASTARSIRLPRKLRSRVEVRAGDLTAPMAALSGFDVVVCHAVLHDVEDPGAVLRVLAACLRPGGEVVGALFTDAYHAGLRRRLVAAGIPLPRPAISHSEDTVNSALVAAGFRGIEIWTEAVELDVDGAGAPAHLERLLGRPVDAAEVDRVLDAGGRPLRIDLSPLSFTAVTRPA
ncbi:MAG TPA: methyltransferase domain-containing protein [Acidimicrobiales bacterium]|jgi:SAM-dependent methyltransferase